MPPGGPAYRAGGGRAGEGMEGHGALGGERKQVNSTLRDARDRAVAGGSNVAASALAPELASAEHMPVGPCASTRGHIAADSTRKTTHSTRDDARGPRTGRRMAQQDLRQHSQQHSIPRAEASVPPAASTASSPRRKGPWVRPDEQAASMATRGREQEQVLWLEVDNHN